MTISTVLVMTSLVVFTVSGCATIAGQLPVPQPQRPSGAFLAGVVMPQKTEFREYLVVRLENFSSLFLLPLFFAFSGLRTQVGLLNDTTSWLVCFAIIGVATLGKLGGTMITARFTGMNWNDSFALGALMNTRGLVELVALNIGYDLGLLTKPLFTMFVIMALLTTVMTGPLLRLFLTPALRASGDRATSQPACRIAPAE